MAIQIQFRRGTAAQWASANTTLAQGELGLEIDTSYFKIGDGNTAWSNLGYAISQLANNALNANNSAYLGGLIATDYQTTAGLASNVATLAANSATYLGGNTALTLRTYTEDKAANAYSNAVSYIETQIGSKVANSITANSATAYNNAVSVAAADATAKVGGVISYVDVRIGTVNTAIVANASAAYTNATVFASNATNINTGTLAEVRLPYRMNQDVRTTDNVTFNDLAVTGNLTVTGNTTIVGANNLVVKDSVISLHTLANLQPWTSNDGKLVGVAYHYYDTQDRQALLAMNPANAFLTYYKTSTDAAAADPTGTDLGTIQADSFYAGNSTVYSTINATIFSGTANNASYLNGNSALTLRTYTDTLSSAAYANSVSYTDTKIGLVNTAITANSATAYSNAVLYVDNKLYVNSSQLSSNLSNYQTTAGLSSNVATLTANNTSFVGTVSAANVVSNSQLSSNLANYVTTTNLTNNLANYQTTAGLSANVATLTANNTSFVGSVSAANVVSNAQLVSNLANYATTTAATAYAATAYSNSVAYVDGKSYVNTSQLSSNLANYQTTAGLASNVATLTANNTSYVGTVSAANVVSNSQLSANLAGYAALSGATFTGAVQISNNLTVSGNITFSGNAVSVGANSLVIQDAVISLHTNSTLGTLTQNDGKLIGVAYHYYDTQDRQALLAMNQSNAFLTYYKTSTDASAGDPTGTTLGTIQADTFYSGNSTVYATTNSTVYTGTANNTLYVGTVSAVNVVSNAQLSANLANYVTTVSLSSYQTTAGLAANVATLTANNTSFVGTVSAANVVSNAQLSSNLANYQTTAGLASNVATLTANNTSFVGTVSAANVVSNSQLSANLANYVTTVSLSGYQTTAGLAANVATLTSNSTNFVGTVSAANVVSNSQLSANLANYQTTAGLSSNVATLTANNTSFVGTVSAINVVSNSQLSANLANYQTTAGMTSYQTTAGLASNVATLTANNTSFVGTVSAVNVVSNSQLSANLANYQTTAGMTAYQTTAGLASNVATLTANNTTYFNGQLASYYTNATNITTGTLPYAQIPANIVNTSANFTITGVYTYNTNLVIGTTAGISANGGYGTSGQVLTSNGTTVYWSTVSGGAGVNTAAQYTWTNTQTFSNTVIFTNAQQVKFQTVNTSAYAYFTQQNDDNFVFYTTNTAYGSRPVFGVYSNSATSNLQIYIPLQLNSGLVANGGLGSAGQVLTSNGSATYWSTVSGGGGGSVDVTAQYAWTNTQSFSNTITFTGPILANTVNAASYNVGTAVVINSTSMAVNNFSIGSTSTATFYNINGQANASAGAFVGNAYATLGGAGGNYLAFGQQTSSAQWIQSGYSSAGAPVYYSIILNPLGGNIGIGNTAPTDRLSVNGTTYLQGAVNSTGTINAAAVTVGTNFIANSTQLTVATPLMANGGLGTSGQVLTSNGATGAPYWSTVSGGGGGFTNGQSIMVSNVAFSNSSNVASVYTYYNQTTNSIDTVFV